MSQNTGMTSPAGLRDLKALSDEVDAASSLFRHGFKILSDYRFASRDADPVFVCLAGGAEKLLKLTLGLYTLDTSQAWPDVKTMKSQWRHQIAALDGHVRDLLRGRLHLSTAEGYMRRLLDKTDHDAVLAQVLETLDRYATQ